MQINNVPIKAYDRINKPKSWLFLSYFSESKKARSPNLVNMTASYWLGLNFMISVGIWLMNAFGPELIACIIRINKACCDLLNSMMNIWKDNLIQKHLEIRTGKWIKTYRPLKTHSPEFVNLIINSCLELLNSHLAFFT